MKRIIKKTLLKTGKYFPQFFSNLVVKKFTDLNSHIFFGYYDTTPFDIKDEKILACRVPIKNHLKSIKMDLGYYYLDKANPKFIKFSETNAWCWQMGARLRWLNNQSDLVSFNTVYKNRYICKIQSINKTNEYESIPLPLYDINNDITYGLSLNFSRLQRLRPGYGYKNILDKSIKIKAPSNDGIILFDFKSKKEELLISLSKISKIEPDKSMKGATHYFNHISFSPNSRFFMFFHLWVNNNKRFSRLFIFDIETCKYKLISKNRVSHYTWKSDTELLITESKDGIVFYTLYNINDNGKISKISGKEKNTTNNKMELMAPISALQKINKIEDVEIFTDSKYVKLGITEWIHKWLKNNWQTSKKEHVKNKELWLKLYELTKSIKVKWVWVKSHAGDPLNEEVDLLAKKAAESN